MTLRVQKVSHWTWEDFVRDCSLLSLPGGKALLTCTGHPQMATPVLLPKWYWSWSYLTSGAWVSHGMRSFTSGCRHCPEQSNSTQEVTATQPCGKRAMADAPAQWWVIRGGRKGERRTRWYSTPNPGVEWKKADDFLGVGALGREVLSSFFALAFTDRACSQVWQNLRSREKCHPW